MEEQEFEKHIKKTLQERSITPSTNAWNVLEEQLGDTPSKKNTKSWYWAAASVAILLIASMFFLKTDKVTEMPAQIVDVEKDQEPQIIEEIPIQNTINNKIVIDEAVVGAPIKKDKKATDIKPLFKDEELKKSKEITNNAVAEAVDIETQKVQEVVARIQVLQNSKTVVTNAEIEALLLQAQKEIRKEKILATQSRVDAMALLLDVEEELDKSFKDKVFEALKKGFVEAKTAVANRNN
jgi:hypothetical protein